MNKQVGTELRELQRFGWNIGKESAIKPNHGSETFRHQVAKTAVLHVGQDNEYRVAGEATHESRGSIDCLLWGNPDRLTYAVEVETSPTREVILDKADRYVGGPVDDILVVNVSEMPMDMFEAREYVRGELGL